MKNFLKLMRLLFKNLHSARGERSKTKSNHARGKVKFHCNLHSYPSTCSGRALCDLRKQNYFFKAIHKGLQELCRNHVKLLLIISIFYSFSLRAEIVETTMYACCSPYGLCDLRLFRHKTICQQICGGHNQCIAKTSNVIRHPLYGLPVAHISPNTSAYITGLTGEANYMAATGGESVQYNAAPRELEISVKAPIAEESRR